MIFTVLKHLSEKIEFTDPSKKKAPTAVSLYSIFVVVVDKVVSEYP